MVKKNKDKTSNTKPKIKIESIELIKVEGKQFKNKKYTDSIIKRTNLINSKMISDKDIEVTLKEKVTLQSVFSIEIEMLGRFHSSEPLKEEELDDFKKALSYPLLSNSSTIISFLTEKFGMLPLILPPILKKDESGKDESGKDEDEEENDEGGA